jgi:hypothetical protein
MSTLHVNNDSLYQFLCVENLFFISVTSLCIQSKSSNYVHVIEESQSFFYTVLHFPAYGAVFQVTFFSAPTYCKETGEIGTCFA